MLDGKREIEDIIAGPFLICSAPLDIDQYQSLPENLMEKYRNRFLRPETFVTDINGKIRVKEIKEIKQTQER